MSLLAAGIGLIGRISETFAPLSQGGNKGYKRRLCMSKRRMFAAYFITLIAAVMCLFPTWYTYVVHSQLNMKYESTL